MGLDKYLDPIWRGTDKVKEVKDKVKNAPAEAAEKIKNKVIPKADCGKIGHTGKRGDVCTRCGVKRL